MAYQPYDFQEEDLTNFINGGHKSGLFAYDMALGKTLIGVELGLRLKTKVNLIIAPKNTQRSWSKTLDTQSDGSAEVRRLDKTVKGLKAFQDYFDGVPGWYFITWELMRNGSIFETKADLVIADEVHAIQNKGKSAQNIIIDGIDTEYKIGLSGTPSGNMQSGIYGVISWLWPKRYKAYWSWIKKHFVLAGSGYNLTPLREITPGSVMGDLPFAVRRLKEDHFADIIPTPLPTKEVVVQLTKEQRSIYEEFKATSGSFVGEDEDGEEGFIFEDVSLVKELRLREIALAVPITAYDEFGEEKIAFHVDLPSTKIDALIDTIKKELNGESLLVFTHSKKIIPIVIERLAREGILARGFDGDTKQKQREDNIDNLGKTYQVLIAGIQAIGEGTDGLQHVCSNMAWLSRHINLSKNVQAMERLARPGQKKQIRSWEFVAEDTNDLLVNARLDDSLERVNNMLNANKLVR